ncbi:hypothetical protein ARALYDRAFT_470101 [Arabidopsis lyrata subsp. lyrata]|uniref:Uncharacterized protein n=1 Tax=Arabidopsis lyrata subsp. lyrata TaxID=81972 RepID=D7KP77_ARALL|nr:hypothetical protein ARALYDRAFT_470101 [Arabidopsis lyrata subsp. lyrata]
MEKSTSPATQVTEPPPTSSLPAQAPPLPTSADQRSAELPSPAQMTAPPSTVTTDPSSRGRKRALEANLQIESSNYYKMRLLVKDLRPHVLEVLRTPDFSNSKAAIEIQEKMKLMLQLYQEMIGESPKREKTAKSESLSNGKATTTSVLRSSETSYVNSDGDGDKVVGGSAFGWNFITSGGPGTEPVYSGMSKEEYRSSHPIIQVEAAVELHDTF